MREYLKRINDMLPQDVILEGLAEESAELGQAALKLARILRGVNPTPVTEGDAKRYLLEELADVSLMISMVEMQMGFDHEDLDPTIDYKIGRWFDRLRRRDA